MGREQVKANPALKGRRIVLRDWQISDLDPLTYWLGPNHRWKELDAPYYPSPTPEEIAGIIEEKKAQIENGALGWPRVSLVIATSETNPLIGRVSWYWESKETNWISVGIVVYDPANWGCGVGYQALGLWSSYLFREMPALVRLDLRTWSGNLGMMRLAQKLGYKEEARFRKARIVNGQYFDGLGYGVLREEWNRLYPHGFPGSLS